MTHPNNILNVNIQHGTLNMNHTHRFDIEPWADPVSGDELLAEICEHLRSVVILPPGGELAIALWIIHTYLLEPANSPQTINTSPVLSINSPDRQCGKSTVKQILDRLVARPCATDNISTASLYRLIEQEQPTLLIDEADTFLMQRQEMIGILNSGYRPDGFVIRQGGTNFTDPIKFPTWGAKAIFSIGILPPALYSRCISIPMKRKRPEEKVMRFNAYLRQRQADLLDIRRKILRFSLDNSGAISICTPHLPESLDDRQQDNWEPLLQIATLCGGDWLQHSIQAAIELSPPNLLDETNLAEMLLADIAGIFDFNDDDRISSASLLQMLITDLTKPWVDYRRGRPITQSDIASLLRRYGIRPVDQRVNGKVLKCYLASDFEDAFARYLGRAATPQQNIHRAIDVIEQNWESS
ncbi:DUF3631 domain-containing protein [Zwartia panacis]|uniref:DUF3631 domain-containing protein n=1 Tax=Zwartia panacis TaxID=2683345 RepID=UPI0025B4C523|nr:DUF3631 domain-containing protein [Zwartia panacis]MDN4016194.1 DUF3631 domain-containing protein [Zwartia panacis]